MHEVVQQLAAIAREGQGTPTPTPTPTPKPELTDRAAISRLSIVLRTFFHDLSSSQIQQRKVVKVTDDLTYAQVLTCISLLEQTSGLLRQRLELR